DRLHDRLRRRIDQFDADLRRHLRRGLALAHLTADAIEKTLSDLRRHRLHGKFADDDARLLVALPLDAIDLRSEHRMAAKDRLDTIAEARRRGTSTAAGRGGALRRCGGAALFAGTAREDLIDLLARAIVGRRGLRLLEVGGRFRRVAPGAIGDAKIEES